MDGPLFSYREKLAAGELKPDPAQELLAEKLQSLHRALNGYRPSTGPVGWKERLGLARRRGKQVLVGSRDAEVQGGADRGDVVLE